MNPVRDFVSQAGGKDISNGVNLFNMLGVYPERGVEG